MSALRHAFEGRQCGGDFVEWLLVAGEDGHHRRAELPGIVERAGLEDEGGKSGPARADMGAAIGAEFARDRRFEIAARIGLWLAAGVAEAIGRHQHEHVGGTAGDVLAFAAMALALHEGFAFGLISQRAAIASAFEFHEHFSMGVIVAGKSAEVMSGNDGRGRPWDEHGRTSCIASFRRFWHWRSPLAARRPARPNSRRPKSRRLWRTRRRRDATRWTRRT